jgi:hypothetical protein
LTLVLGVVLLVVGALIVHVAAVLRRQPLNLDEDGDVHVDGPDDGEEDAIKDTMEREGDT